MNIGIFIFKSSLLEKHARDYVDCMGKMIDHQYVLRFNIFKAKAMNKTHANQHKFKYTCMLVYMHLQHDTCIHAIASRYMHTCK